MSFVDGTRHGKNKLIFVDCIQNIHALTIVTVSLAERCSTGFSAKSSWNHSLGAAAAFRSSMYSTYTITNPNSHQACLDSCS
mmetsp:Transcript_10704/g.15459  ORF Transcript_10704/g.15459 Transcript_10704/m.15459 type:complete len:82 (-) Transcript_10704:151-396(-)